MSWVVLIIILVVSMFGFVLLFGPPYVPTLNKQKMVALDLLDLRAGQTLLELGSGDGRVMLEAAKRGLNVVGIELNPILVIVSRIVTWRYRKQVRVILGSYWNIQWPQADGIFTFLLPRQMTKLNKYIESWQTRPVQLSSFAFSIPGKKPLSKKEGVFLYAYPLVDAKSKMR